MTVHTLDPLEDSRWAEFIDRHPSASVFHRPEWATALQQTYGFRPVVYTTTPPDAALTNGILVCRVDSWLTGSRLVSVPFADHCEPLIETADDHAAVTTALLSETRGLKYVELRPALPWRWGGGGLEPAASFQLHVLDLRPSSGQIYRGFHESTIQRKIRRAEREGVVCGEGRSEVLLQAFYRLLLLTRRRHGIPPQPIEWFRSLLACFGSRATIRVAFRSRQAIGAILTLQHGKTLVYKYGVSDAGFHKVGTMPLLFWTAIQDAKWSNAEWFDLGRSDPHHHGLILFKERLGAAASTLTYLRSAAPGRWSLSGQPPWAARTQARIVRRLPDRLSVALGGFLYKHVA